MEHIKDLKDHAMVVNVHQNLKSGSTLRSLSSLFVIFSVLPENYRQYKFYILT